MKIAGQTDFSGSFSFQILESGLKPDDLKKLKEPLMKWFNLQYDELGFEAFLNDLLNSMDVRSEMSFLPFSWENGAAVKARKLRASLTNLDIFDKLETNGIVIKDNIRGVLDDPFEGIEIQDLLRQLILREESEFYDIFSKFERDELLFRVFRALVLGGSLCQYEDKLSPYLEATKIIYRSLVSPKKDAASNSVFIESYAYEIEAIGKELIGRSGNPQDFLYVVVNPGSRVVHLLSNSWEKYW